VSQPHLLSNERNIFFLPHTLLTYINPITSHLVTRMTLLLRCIRPLFCKVQWPELQFPKTGFEIVGDDYLLEGERITGFSKDILCPVNIGDVFASRYQVVAKLGYGVTSTVWLARDLRSDTFFYFHRSPSNESQK
jgi:hypothetical protein